VSERYFLFLILQVLVNYARSSKEAEEVSKEVGESLIFIILMLRCPSALHFCVSRFKVLMAS